MTREKVFGRLRDLGAKVAMVVYQGGHDESFIEGVFLYNFERQDIQYNTPAIALGEPVSLDGVEYKGMEDEDKLADALVQPIYDYLGEAFGDAVDGVDGQLVWYVAEEKVMIEHGYLEWIHEEKDL